MQVVFTSCFVSISTLKTTATRQWQQLIRGNDSTCTSSTLWVECIGVHQLC